MLRAMVLCSTLTLFLGMALGVDPAEKTSLETLFSDTTGTNWTNHVNWTSGDPLTNSWYGVSADQGLTHITRLALPNNNVCGNFPEFLSGLSWLKEVDLSDNRLTRFLPSQFPATLQTLNLSRNSMYGSLYGSVENATGLKSLYLDGNVLHGVIPASWKNMTQLTTLDLRYNSLYTSDPTVRSFINARQIGGDFEATQTVLPTNIAHSFTGNRLDMTWTPIRFTQYDGGYLVYAAYPLESDTSSYAYLMGNGTKNATGGHLVLSRGIPYSIRLYTLTDSHPYNFNNIASDDYPMNVTPPGVAGDINGNGSRTIDDAEALAGYLAGNPGCIPIVPDDPASGVLVGDVTGNFGTNLLDLVWWFRLP